MNKIAKTSNQLFFIQNMFLVVLFFCGLFCASHTNTIRAKRQIPNDGNFTGDKLKDWQVRVADQTTCEEDTVLLVKILKSLGASLTESVKLSEQEYTDNYLSEIKEVWQCLVVNHKGLANSGESPESLRAYMANIFYLTNERHCKSPDETFLNGQCLPISTENWSEHCPEHMGLYDGPDNEGICDCLELSGEKAKFELPQIFSDSTGSCHPQNTRGPCEDGQWFVMKNTAQCETVPEGCPTDGHHVYWSPDETSVAKQCWEIGTRGPCEDGKLIHLEQDKEELKIWVRIFK
uniref:DUF4789 domain-containing protein n=1 Tax=Daphnia galeata TaxID=27404 RepID=A0A8J2WG39_9CRUS|nr:unnamed protein product [Daphnia galeata]